MEFFPLTLGVPKRRTPGREADDRGPRAQLDYDAWRESASLAEEFERHAAEDVLVRHIRVDPALPKRPWLILGEPGAGKTRLMEHWHATWLRQLPQPVLGMRVPVLVRFKDIPRSVLAGDPAAVADALWSSGLAVGKSQVKGTASAAAIFGVSPRVFTPIWLLDALDELSGPIADRGLWDLLRALPGEVALTCRTAVFQAARAEIADLIGNEWRILGLEPQEQEEFLRLAYVEEGTDPGRAPEMVRDLNANASLSPLAASPLMLNLVAEAGPNLKLPATRAGFYEAATNALWERRLRNRPDQLDLTPERDAALAALAARLGLNALETRQEALRETAVGRELREALRLSGLLRFDDRHGRIGFPHLTFQEFHLARALVPRPFADVLDDHWSDARYEETLALLIALHAEEGRGRLIEAGLRDFVAKARAAHAANPQPFWSLGRSPLRTALHLLARAAVPTLALPLELKDEPALLRFAIVRDPATPGAALAALVRDPDTHVRRWAARNVATPGAALAALVRDPDTGVRRGAAGNPATPGAALAEFARDPDTEVREAAAWNAATPGAALAALVRDPDTGVRRWAAGNATTQAAALAEFARDPDKSDTSMRRWAAGNAATPAAALAELARDPEKDIREAAAGNAATPGAALVELARDPDTDVRRWAAGNVATPGAALAEFARDLATDVRRWAARNVATPGATLAELARDPDMGVRRKAAENAATPGAALAELARDPDTGVRRGAARNAATPAAVLAELARNPNTGVRRGAAENAATPGAALAELARDPEKNVRWLVVRNAATPGTALAELARDPEKKVREAAAWNAATPGAALAELARDPDTGVRRKAAENAATPGAALAELARDPDAEVREAAAENAATPGAALAELAWDPDEDVHKEAAGNARTLLEDLAGPPGPTPGGD